MATREKSSKAEEDGSIAAFYAGRSIMVTGGTGFVGKVLIEKLLRSCPDVREIFLLMRPRRDASIDDRLREMLKLPLFDQVREKNRSCLEKLIPVSSDMNAEGLGLGNAERRLLIERVSVIFHVAANVRFNHNLQKDILSNVRSTRDICILAGSMKKLVALTHVSTAYAHTDKPVIEEIVYPPLYDWRAAIRTAESLDEETMRIFANKYVDPMPNTYTFSKRLAEQVINDYAKDLPSVILRPSIVVSTIDEPVAGWVDNFNGPVGIMVGGGKGILRVVNLAQSHSAGDYLPVDVVVKGILATTWKRGATTITKDPSAHVYNCTNNGICRVTTEELIALALKMNEQIPIEGTVWYPRIITTSNRSLHYVLTLFLHVLPAFILDEFSKLTGRKPMLMDIQKKIYNITIQLSHFMNNEWSFINNKMVHMLMNEVPPPDRQIFGYDYKNLVMDGYFRNALIGAKLYLLNEDMSRIGKAKRHYERMRVIDSVFRGCTLLMFLWILTKIGVLSYFVRTICSILDGSFLLDE